MGDSVLVRPRGNFQNKKEESWWERVTENARAFLELRSVPALAHGGAGAFDLLEGRPEPGRRQRQAGSLVVHAVAVGILLWVGTHVPQDPPRQKPIDGGVLLPPLKRLLFQTKPDDGGGKGSNQDSLPPTKGILAPLSNVVLIRPHLPDEKPHILLVNPTVYDADAVMSTRPATNLGLPWMNDRNKSNGNDGGDTMGTKRGDHMGSTDGDYEGELGGTRYVPGTYPVRCVYCPDPEYTDEARHTKTQGSVLLRVLVTADGRASQIRIEKGIGLGLDERAVEKVKTWRFEPARDANKKAITQWATVEVTYRLF